MTAIPATKPKLAWLWIRLNSPLDNGLSSDDEFESLCDFEDDLETALVPFKTCQYAGRITTKGRREFYFYVSREFDFQKAVDDVLTKHREYRFQLGEKLDVSMDHYFLTLLPGNNGRDQIERRRTEQ
jgi:hypothetical protein